MSNDELSALQQQVNSAYGGPERVSALSALADWLEADGQLERVFELKLQITHEADYAGLYERALEAFAWCRARQAADPKRFPQDILPAHERLVHAVIGKVPWAKAEPVLDDFERATRAAGGSMYRVYWQRQVIAWFRGDEPAADQYAELMLREPLPPGRCRVCDVNFMIRRVADRGEYEKVMQMAEPLLRGERKCDSVPRNTYYAVMYPLLRLGRKDEAEQCYRRGYKSMSERYRAELGFYLRYIALVEDWETGMKLLEKHMGEPSRFTLPSYAFTFYEGAWVLCEKLRRAGIERLPVALSKKLGLVSAPDGTFATAALADWLHAEMRRIATFYDTNNGTDRFARLLARDAELVDETYAPRPSPAEPEPPAGGKRDRSRRLSRR
jgi:hypothetical protein